MVDKKLLIHNFYHNYFVSSVFWLQGKVLVFIKANCWNGESFLKDMAGFEVTFEEFKDFWEKAWAEICI